MFACLCNVILADTINLKEAIVSPFVQIVYRRYQEKKVLPTFDNFGIERVLNESKGLVIVPTCGKHRHLLHVFQVGIVY